MLVGHSVIRIQFSILCNGSKLFGAKFRLAQEVTDCGFIIKRWEILWRSKNFVAKKTDQIFVTVKSSEKKISYESISVLKRLAVRNRYSYIPVSIGVCIDSDAIVYCQIEPTLLKQGLQLHFGNKFTWGTNFKNVINAIFIPSNSVAPWVSMHDYVSYQTSAPLVYS